MAAHGTSGFYAAQVAAVETRERKEHVDLARLREDWRARAAEHGLGQPRAASSDRTRAASGSRPRRELLALAPSGCSGPRA